MVDLMYIYGRLARPGIIGRVKHPLAYIHFHDIKIFFVIPMEWAISCNVVPMIAQLSANWMGRESLVVPYPTYDEHLKRSIRVFCKGVQGFYVVQKTGFILYNFAVK